MLHLPLRAANLILELPAGVLEGIVKGECQIGISLVCRRRPSHIHLAAVGKRETNVDLVKTAFSVMPTGPIQHDPARGYATPTLFELRHVRRNSISGVPAIP